MNYYDLSGSAVVRLTHEKRCEECGASDVQLVQGAAQVSGLYRMTYIGADSVRVKDWVWLPSADQQTPGEWELEVTWFGIGGMMWSSAVTVPGVSNRQPDAELTKHLTRILTEEATRERR